MGDNKSSLNIDVSREQDPFSKLDESLRGEPDCVAVVEVVLVRVQEDVGVHHHRVRGLLEVRDHRPVCTLGHDIARAQALITLQPVIMFSKNVLESGLDEMQHDVGGVPPEKGSFVLSYSYI